MAFTKNLPGSCFRLGAKCSPCLFLMESVQISRVEAPLISPSYGHNSEAQRSEDSSPSSQTWNHWCQDLNSGSRVLEVSITVVLHCFLRATLLCSQPVRKAPSSPGGLGNGPEPLREDETGISAVKIWEIREEKWMNEHLVWETVHHFFRKQSRRSKVKKVNWIWLIHLTCLMRVYLISLSSTGNTYSCHPDGIFTKINQDFSFGLLVERQGHKTIRFQGEPLKMNFLKCLLHSV